MAVRDDILNFMRSIKAGKQAVSESRWKEGAYAEAQQAHQQTLEMYAQQLTDFETDLAGYQQRVGAWESDVAAKQSAYDTATGAYPGQKTKYDSTVATFTTQYGDPSTWSSLIKNSFKVASGGFAYGSPPQPPALPSFLPQPAALETEHPGPTPSFEFSIPETPYTAALAKSAQASSMPTLNSAGQTNNYYRALEAQANQPKWWERNG